MRSPLCDLVGIEVPLIQAGMSIQNPAHNAPDAGFYYSNTNTVLLGLIAEQLDGKPLDRVLHDRLFGPLGMPDTFLPKTTSNNDPRTRAHRSGRVRTATPRR